ncbi:metal-sulfur cluster assembly factor [Salinirubellus salinus]|jgi:metal-sulfur cluster biosynthetic enzyme|uniref:Metal-sulfur cluster assembly factor n=1 Tax=Salinirubellus salinus TaxID=1364945 RepID=A0A9E7R594_9EURY|nr:1,2-phenylacetyl-CoA epoxidase subunit PaaD [Salinirubellus salinus]UWM55822.1 metal-sulfur cluster assembly factor [Salinirubellus salinus]
MASGEFDDDPRYCGYTTYEFGEVDPDGLPATGEGATGVERRVWDALYEVEDPEMPVSVVDLGLIYGVDVTDGHASVRMTLTYTGCPARDMLLGDVESAAASAEGVESSAVELVWSPEWSLDLVTEAGKTALREFGVSI